jgi:hypothetical protein
MSTSTANLGLSGAQTTQAIAAMDAFCNLLLSIHIDSSPAVPQVGAHLAGAQQTAQLWLKTTHQQTKNGLNLTASVANDFVGGIYPTLSTLAGKVPPEWGMWKNGLAQVGNRVSIAERCVQQGIEGVNQFRQAVTPICQGFASDAVAALSKVKGDEAEIARLQGDIERLQNKIDDDRKYENIGWILGPRGWGLDSRGRSNAGPDQSGSAST